jgi:hypothetical protein
MEFEISHVTRMGIICLTEIVPKHFPYQINETNSEPINYQQTFEGKIHILGDMNYLEQGHLILKSSS